MEGIKHKENALYVVNNTMYYENHRSSWFVRVENAPAGFQPHIRNNVCIGSIPLTNSPSADAGGNLLLKTIAEGHFRDPARLDFHLQADSPCVDKGIDPGKVGDVSLVPEFQYVHPCRLEARPHHGKLDIGAYEMTDG